MENTASNLRNRAQALLNISGTDVAGLSPLEIQKLVYELQVHQIELELQNEELKKSQHDLSVSHERLAKVFNSSPIGYLMLNKDGAIESANQAAANFLGTSLANLKLKKFTNFINADDQDKYYFFFRDLLANGNEAKVELRIKQTDNKPNLPICLGFNHPHCSPETCNYKNIFTYIDCRGVFVCKENSGTEILLSIFDISQDKYAHETIVCLNEKLEQTVFKQTHALTQKKQNLIKKIGQLKFYKHQAMEREAMLNTTFDAAVDGIATLYTTGEISYVNNAMERIFGYDKTELLGLNIENIIPSPKKNRHEKNSCNHSTIELLSNLGTIKETKGIRKDKSAILLDISVAQFSLEGIGYLTCIIRDVTARKRQEQSDQQHLEELAHVTRLSLMGEMASGIAHEVNQPLTAIVNYAQVCLGIIKKANVNLPQLGDTLEKVNHQALRAGQIIHRMRDFVKSKKIHHSNVDINELIYDAVGLCESYIKQNSICVQYKLATLLPLLCIDSIQIEQVILNLIRNSIDVLADLPHSIPRKLSIETSMTEDNEIEIRIKDNGSGIDKADQKKILTPFYTTKTDGMGMGLSICRSIIEAHGGILRFNSNKGKGTTFYFTLPNKNEANGC